ncbi:MAG: DUF3343 domain-containing protein [Clostridiales bacterium]|nr:DUF3343 domain-containing protein [Clostridiales bacterium]MDD7386605.1 DUF3343 domain-containing protein [Bacillota bacterium]MDY6040558.1 DUF3343 domain-containing protein [Candidatus Faecousia sp.]
MNVYYITFRSVTFAQRGEEILRRGGISSVLQRTPRWMEEQGCGYCLRLRTDDVQTGAALLRGSRIPFRKIYLQQPEGNVEELAV